MPARRKSGFTLIELLVVIAIIAILAAILFPVFAKAREAARKTTCQSNMKECATALHTYWNDYDACLPSSYLVNYNTSNNDYMAFATKLGAIPPAVNTRPTTWCQILYGHMKSKDIMFCPSDSQDHTLATATVSYWWKFAIDAAWRGQGTTNSDLCQKEGDFAFNSDQVVLYEHKGWHFGDSTGIKSGTQINCAFLDSHVKTVALGSSTPSSYIDESAPYNTAGEPMYFNKYNPDSGTAITSKTPVKWVDPRQYCDDL